MHAQFFVWPFEHSLNIWSLLLIMRQGTQHSKNIVFKSKYIYEIIIGSYEKAKVSCTGLQTSARSIYSWSRISTLSQGVKVKGVKGEG